jgi:hypothetical protein
MDMSNEISRVLNDEELELLDPYLALRTKDIVDAQRHNDAVIEAYLLGKMERENGQ